MGEVESIEKHPHYHKKHSWYNDIAVLKLKQHVTLNDKVGVVCLPEDDEQPTSDMTCFITGWGKLDARNRGGTNILNEAQLNIVPMQQCLHKNKELTSSITERLCGGNHGNTEGLGTNVSACLGDSGGPYACQRKDKRWVLQGVVSYGSNRCDSR